MMKLTIRNNVQVSYVNEAFDDFLYNSLTMMNPIWVENHRLGRFNWKTDKELFFYEEKGENGFYAPRGFLKNIVKYCVKHNHKYEIKIKTCAFEDINIDFSGQLKPFQDVATKIMLQDDIGTLCAPTGSGKTVMGIYMMAVRKQPTIIIVHTKELLFQWIDRIKEFTNIDEEDIGVIGSGQLDEDKHVTVALVQTLKKHPELVNTYGYLLVDECHRCPSKTFTDIVKGYDGKFLTGLSATPFRRDGLSKCIEFYCGPILHKIEPAALIKEGHIIGIEAIIRKTNFIASMENPADEYSKLLKELSWDKERNLMIVADIVDAVKSGETCLVLSDRKAHCQELSDVLYQESNLNSTVLTGDVGIDKRRQIVKDVNDGSIKVLVCTGQLIGEGFDCKNLTAVFLTLPVRFSGRVIQYIGRVLRPKPGKDKALVYDYIDPSVKCLWNGVKARQKEYDKLEVKKEVKPCKANSQETN